MTQREIEKRLASLQEEREEAKSLDLIHLRAIEQKQLELYAQIDEARSTLARLGIERHKVQDKIREVNMYYQKKRRELLQMEYEEESDNERVE